MPRPDAGFRLAMAAYWLAVGVWLGAIILFALAAANTFAVLRASPGVGADVDTTAGDVVNGLFSRFSILQVICGGVLIGIVVVQHLLWRDRLALHGWTWSNGLRIVLLALALSMGSITSGYIVPEAKSVRLAAHAQGEKPGDDFQRLHHLSERLMGGVALCLLGAGLVTPFAFASGASSATIEQPRRPHE